jgi:ketol-acid reductoisomerase
MDVIRDADINPLLARTIGIIGYGNQGRAQALNLRDSGARVLIGSVADASAARARDDGFEVVDIAAATERADVLALLIPDEVQRGVYEQGSAAPARGQILVFAHGCNIHYG